MTEEKKMLFSQDALKKLLWPLIIEQFLAIAMGMADTEKLWYPESLWWIVSAYC